VKRERFVPKVGARLSEAQAQFIGGIATKHGGLAAQHAAPALIEASAAETSPTHGLFEWDDAKAAGEHRLHTARRLIGSVMIVLREDDEGNPEATAPAFVSIRVESEQERMERFYFPSRAAMEDDKLREQVFTEVERRLRSAKMFAGSVKELAAVVDGAIAEAAALRRKTVRAK
jgi:hypothetical protein